MRIVPEPGSSKRAMSRVRVVLPDPEGPISAVVAPAGMHGGGGEQ